MTSDLSKPDADRMINELADRFWRVQPRDLQDRGITRQEFYRQEITTLLARIIPAQSTPIPLHDQIALDTALGIENLPREWPRGRRVAAIQVAIEGELSAALREMEARKNAAYEERNKVVAALAKIFPSGTARTEIPGWSVDWHGCVYIDLPTGQVSWHYHDSHDHLFADLPPYARSWDGHDTQEKYRRLAALSASRTPGAPEGGEALEPFCGSDTAQLREALNAVDTMSLIITSAVNWCAPDQNEPVIAAIKKVRAALAIPRQSQEANVPPDALDLAQELYEFAPAMSRGEKITWDMLPSGTGLREHILGLARHILAKYDLRAKR